MGVVRVVAVVLCFGVLGLVALLVVAVLNCCELF